MKKILGTSLLAATIALTGCGGPQTRVISDAESQEFTAATLSDNDFAQAAKEMLDDMMQRQLSTPKANGKPYVMIIGDIKNDTQQRIDTDELTDYIKEELNNSGLVKTTRAFGANRNTNVAASRQLADSDLVDKSTVKKNGTVKAFDLELTGRIAQKNEMVDRKTKMITYVFSLSLVDMGDGTELWSKKRTIKKLTDKNTQTW